MKQIQLKNIIKGFKTEGRQAVRGNEALIKKPLPIAAVKNY